MARKLRRECKRKGTPFSAAVEFAIRSGMRRQDAIKCAQMAYRMNRSQGASWRLV